MSYQSNVTASLRSGHPSAWAIAIGEIDKRQNAIDYWLDPAPLDRRRQLSLCALQETKEILPHLVTGHMLRPVAYIIEHYGSDEVGKTDMQLLGLGGTEHVCAISCSGDDEGRLSYLGARPWARLFEERLNCR